MANETLEEKIRLYVQTTGDKEVGALYAQLTKLAEGADTSAEQAGALVEELERLATVSSAIRSFPALKQQLADTGDELEQAKSRAAALRAEFNAAEQPTKRLATSLQRADAAVVKLTETQSRQQAELARTAKALRDAGVDTERLGEAATAVQWQFGQFAEKASSAAGAAERLSREGQGAAGGINAIERAARGAAGQVGAIGAKLTAVAASAAAAVAAMAAAGTAALFTGAIRSAATLEDALAQVRAVSGATADEMAQLKAAAEQAGATTRFSTLEAAQGLGELARATGSASAAIQALPATLNLAQAAGLGVAEAAQIMTTAMTQFGLSADQAARVANVMAKEANSTNDDVVSLGNALSYAAPLAAQLGMDIEDTAAALGVLAQNGFKGERAGTALRFTLGQLLDTSSEFSRAVRALGVDSTDLGEVLTQLATKGEAGKRALLLLGTEASPAITSLVKDGGAALAALEGQLRNAGGEAERTARIMGDNLTSAGEAISDTFDRTRRALVDPLLEPLKVELLDLAKQLERFAASPDFATIRESLKVLFVEGAEAARELIENIDFKAVAEEIREFATDSDGSLTSFRENLGLVTDAVRIIGQTTAVVFNAVQTAVLGIATAVTRSIEVLARAVNGLEPPVLRVARALGLVEGPFAKFEEIAGGMAAVSDEFGRRTVKNFDEMLDAAGRVGDGVGEATAKATAGVEGFTAANHGLARSNGEVAESATKAKEAHDAQGKSAEAAAKTTAAAATAMEKSAARLQQAFSDLGIKSQADLQRSADVAKRGFEQIRAAAAAGQATAEDVRRAFAAYAEAARAAVADSDASMKARVEGELAVQAAIAGVTNALKQQGEQATRAGQQMAQGAVIASDAMQQAASQADSYSNSVEWLSNSTAKAGQTTNAAKQELKSFGLVLGSVSEEFLRAAMGANRFVNSVNTATFAKMLNRVTDEYDRQYDRIRAITAEIEKQIAAFDPLTKRVEELRAEYRYLGDDQLRALAEREQQLADLQARQREEAARAREASARTADGAAEAAAAITRRTSDLANAANDAADALDRAAAAGAPASPSVTPRAGASAPIEIVVRVVNDQSGGSPLRLSDGDIRAIAAAVLREIQWSKRLAS